MQRDRRLRRFEHRLHPAAPRRRWTSPHPRRTPRPALRRQEPDTSGVTAPDGAAVLANGVPHGAGVLARGAPDGARHWIAGRRRRWRRSPPPTIDPRHLKRQMQTPPAEPASEEKPRRLNRPRRPNLIRTHTRIQRRDLSHQIPRRRNYPDPPADHRPTRCPTPAHAPANSPYPPPPTPPPNDARTLSFQHRYHPAHQPHHEHPHPRPHRRRRRQPRTSQQPRQPPPGHNAPTTTHLHHHLTRPDPQPRPRPQPPSKAPAAD